MMRQVARATARLVPWCLICLLFSQNGSVSSSELNTADSAFVNNYLPDCTNNNNNNNNENSKSNLFIVSTLEGKLSVIDGISGILKWSKQITSGPLLSSSISDFMVNNKGEIVRIVPSLDGNLFVHNGRTIKQTPFSTEKLLKSSLKFSENVLLVGGQENQIVGLNLEDGSVTYECGFKGCSQVENMTFEDVVLLKKTSQSVRAINSLNGKEEWHFVVNDPQLLNVARQHCHNGQSNGQPKYSVDFKVIVPSGLIYSSVYYLDELATKQLYKEWDLKFDSPIVNVWHYEQGKLEQVNLFNRKTIGISRMYVDQNGKEHTITSDQEQLKLLNEENTLDEGNLSEPDFYIGSHNNQLYIQKSPFQKSQTSLLAQSEDNELSDLSDQNTAIVQVEWKQPSASTVGEDTATGGDASKKLADKFEISAKLSFPFSQKLNSTGYYIFKLNHSSESNKCERIAGTEELTTIEHETENIINEIVYTSLSYYWKEIVAICLISWVVLNFFTLIFKNYALEPIKNYLWPTNGEMDTGKNKESWEKSEAPVGESSTAVREASSSGGGNEASENLTYNSRYKQDFDQISLLGKGGFGLVFECKHKIDESLYAVKRISIPAEQEKRERFMREIRVLSKLNHSGIVRYYNAWIEEPPVGWQEQQDQLHHIDFTQCSSEDCSQTENGESQLSLDQSRPTRSSSSLGKTYQSNTSLEIVFKDKSCEQDTDDEEKKDKAAVWSDGDCGHKSSDNCDRSSSNCETKCLEEEEDEEAEEEVATSVHLHESVRSKQPSAKVYVYIQMQLCRKETLKDWLLENKDRDKHQVLNIFLQLIDAVHYVHSNKLIHRDLKPSNIFFSMDGLIKIGDFGLVTNTVEDHFEPNAMEDESQKRLLTNNVGTQLYMSPEQIKKKPYDHKVDIFSLGIILYELLQSFNTEYERILTLNSVRNMKFPPEFTERHSKETQVLQRLLSLMPNERPEASDLLSEDIFSKAKQVT